MFSSSLSLASVPQVMALSRVWGVTGHTAQQEQQGCTRPQPLWGNLHFLWSGGFVTLILFYES